MLEMNAVAYSSSVTHESSKDPRYDWYTWYIMSYNSSSTYCCTYMPTRNTQVTIHRRRQPFVEDGESRLLHLDININVSIAISITLNST